VAATATAQQPAMGGVCAAHSCLQRLHSVVPLALCESKGLLAPVSLRPKKQQLPSKALRVHTSPECNGGENGRGPLMPPLCDRHDWAKGGREGVWYRRCSASRVPRFPALRPSLYPPGLRPSLAVHPCLSTPPASPAARRGPGTVVAPPSPPASGSQPGPRSVAWNRKQHGRTTQPRRKLDACLGAHRSNHAHTEMRHHFQHLVQPSVLRLAKSYSAPQTPCPTKTESTSTKVHSVFTSCRGRAWWGRGLTNDGP
jgi:hypothetical protein